MNRENLSFRAHGDGTLGLYVHVPFCDGKCPYCDFYSMDADDSVKDAYANALCKAIACWGVGEQRVVDTVYFGGGTPPLLGTERLCRVLKKIQTCFSVAQDAEITLEANPRTAPETDWARLRESGFNRLSMGLQSADNRELARLGRRHTAEEAASAVAHAQGAGFDHISLDLMLAIPGQTMESLSRSVSFCASLGVEHISAYLLKIEPGTPFAARGSALHLPGEEAQCEYYLQACALLEENGYVQYEISNFAKPGRESRHNLRYWRGQDYLGIGPAAHSCYRGRRFFYPRDLEAFLQGGAPVGDGESGGMEEFVMLRLRLAEGMSREEWTARFGGDFPAGLEKKARLLARAGLAACTREGIRLTRKGFLVSNEIICQLLLELENGKDNKKI